jgi:hypothetical protein
MAEPLAVAPFYAVGGGFEGHGRSRLLERKIWYMHYYNISGMRENYH